MNSKKVLLIADVRGWAWWYRACDLKAYAPSEYEVDVCVQAEIPERLDKYDAVFCFSWIESEPDGLKRRGAQRVVGLVTCGGLLFDSYDSDNWRSKVWTALRNKTAATKKLPRFHRLIAVNGELAEAAFQYAEVKLIPSGINTCVFAPAVRCDRALGPIRAGWCASPRGVRSVKGYEELLMPLMSELREDGIEWRINTTDYRWPMNRKEMVEWYRQLDLLVSTSIIDGTPSPPFEAAACGIPFLSTDVGCVSDWKAAREMGCVGSACVGKNDVVRTVDWFADKIRQYRDNRKALETTGEALCSAVQEYSYEKIAPRYLEAIANE